MPDDFKYDVFPSHHRADRLRVRRLAELLKAAEVNPKAEGKRQNAELLPSSFLLHPSDIIPLLLHDCAPRDTLRRCKVADFREESEAGFSEVPATLRDTLLPKRRSGELSVNGTAA